MSDVTQLRRLVRALRWIAPPTFAVIACEQRANPPNALASASAPGASAAVASKDAGLSDSGHLPRGKWCAPRSVADRVGFPGSPRLAGCIRFVDGWFKAEAGPHPSVAQLPNDARGWLDEAATQAVRRSDPETCCYDWREREPGGRPFLREDEALREVWGPGAGFALPLALGGVEAAPALAAEWLDDAAIEHASVASFQRARAELRAVGAPAALLAGYEAAARDELRHARRCAGVAVAYGSAPSAPRASLDPVPRRLTLLELGRVTLCEAVLPESLAALVAADTARRCHELALAELWRELADDEARHAALAWDTLRYLVTRDAGVAAALVAELAAERRRYDGRAPRSASPRPGRPDPAAVAELRTAVFDELAAPLLDEFAQLAAQLSAAPGERARPARRREMLEAPA